MLELKDFITPTELAQQTGINKYTLLARIRSRQIETHIRGRMIFIKREDVPKISDPVTRPYRGRSNDN